MPERCTLGGTLVFGEGPEACIRITGVAPAPGGWQAPPLIYRPPCSQEDSGQVKSNDAVLASHVLGQPSPLPTILSPF